MRVFNSALTAVIFALLFGAVCFASFVVTATLHRSLASIVLTSVSPG